MTSEKQKLSNKKYRETHKEEAKEYQKKYKKEHQEKNRKYQREWMRKQRSVDREKYNSYQRQWRKNNLEKVRLYDFKKYHKDIEYSRKLAREYYNRNPEKYRFIQKIIRMKRKLKVMKHYSPELKCECCGENNIEFLTLEHPNLDGPKLREHRLGTGYYSWLIKNNFPHKLKVLCLNCNFSIGRYGYCPHHKESKFKHLEHIEQIEES